MIEIAEDQVVLTYVASGWPGGCLTGYEDAGGFVLCHVVAFQPRVLLPMLREGIAVAASRGYDHIRLRLPQAFPETTRLRILALHMGFRRYHEDAEWLDYVRYL